MFSAIDSGRLLDKKIQCKTSICEVLLRAAPRTGTPDAYLELNQEIDGITHNVSFAMQAESVMAISQRTDKSVEMMIYFYK